MATGVLLALRGPLEEHLVSAIGRTRGLRVVRRCADVAELLAAALAGLGAIAVVDAESGVDRSLITRLRGAGTRTLVLCDGVDAARLRGLGALALERGTSEADILGAVVAMADGADDETYRVAERFSANGHARGPDDDPPPRGGGSGGVAQVPGDVAVAGTGRRGLRSRRPTGDAVPGAGAGEAVLAGADGGPDDGRPPPASPQIVTVWGASGSPGRTTVALNLAAELAAAGAQTLLIDADVWGSAVAASLGVLDESAGVAAAVRAADHGALDVDSLARLCPFVAPGLRVLSGLARAERWRELSSSSIGVVWEQARLLCPWVVIDCGTLVPDDDGAGGFDALLGPRRNAVATSAIEAADHLVIVGAAEPIGIERLVQAILDLDVRVDRARDAPRTVLVNRLRVSAAGPRPAESVREALSRFAGVLDPVLVPDDRPACDRALLAGAALREVAPRSPAREAIRDLALLLLGRPPGPKRREGGSVASRLAVRRPLNR